MILVPLFDLKFLSEFAASTVGTSNRRHQRGANDAMTEALLQTLNERRGRPRSCPQGRFDGRGIVICAGGPRYFTCAWVLISVLRHVHRVALPIQVWHLGRSEM